MAIDEQRFSSARTRWPGAPYLQYVDNRYHVRLLAMARLGLLPLEIETGRWAGVPRHTRLCTFGCNEVGDLAHFLCGCQAITAEKVISLNRYGSASLAANRLRFWRETARTVECRWRQRTQLLRATTDEPQHPVSKHDAGIAQEIINDAMDQLTPEDIRFYTS